MVDAGEAAATHGAKRPRDGANCRGGKERTMRNRVGSNVDIKLSWEQVESRSEMLTGMWRLKESARQPLMAKALGDYLMGDSGDMLAIMRGSKVKSS